MRKLLAGIDLGTTGVRCVLFDLEGIPVSEAYREYATNWVKPGWAEQDIAHMIDETMAVCREAVARAGALPDQIAALGVASQSNSLIALDRRGQPVRPMISWQDRRALPDMPDILRIGSGEPSYRSVTGLPLRHNHIIAKILWMRRYEPELYERTHRFVQPLTFVLRAFGAEDHPADLPGMQWCGVWDIWEDRWSAPLLERFGVGPERFGQPTPPGTRVATVPPAVAAQTGLAVGTHVCVGAHDDACGFVGMGSTARGMATVTLGTSGAAFLAVDGPIGSLDGMLVARHALPRLWAVGGYSLAAASSYRWFRDTVGTLERERAAQQGGSAFDHLNALAAQAQPGSSGLLFLPYLNGAAIARPNPSARAAFIGMSMAHGRAELTRAVMEGVALEMHDTMAAWHRNGLAVSKLRLGGGATRSTLWNQIQADVYGRPVQILRVGESTVLGAAILGGVGAGVFGSVQEGVDAMVHVAGQVEPDAAHHRVYEDLYAAYVQAYEGLSAKAFDTLAAMQAGAASDGTTT